MVTSTHFTPKKSAQYSFLIIGYGNELRGDDGIGAKVAQTVAYWHLPSVKALATHQLVPELSTEIVQADYVIFVDACGEESCARNVQLDPITLGTHDTQPASRFSHSHSPNQGQGHSQGHSQLHNVRGLLQLTEHVYGHVPQAWLLQVPSERFTFGEQLSSIARHGCDQALRVIERFLTNYQVSYSAPPEPCMKSA